jgi:hypothetical protein
MRQVCVILAAITATDATARKTNFLEDHQGFTLGAGTYWAPIASQNIYDPVPQIAPSGTEVQGSKGSFLIPGRLGYFRELGRSSFEFYGRYMINTRHTWTTSGSIDTSGQTLYNSFGAGALLSGTAARYSHFRINVTASAEYMFQRATLRNGADTLTLKANSILLGPGLQWELYLGDLWVLSLHTAYHYGWPTYTWSAAKAAQFLGQNIAQGNLSSLGRGAVKSHFGGFLAEVGFKLLLY